MRYLYLSILILISFSFCNIFTNKKVNPISEDNVRQLVDTVGFAQYPWQMDSLMARIGRQGWKRTSGSPWKLAICPHDDYTYAGRLYPEVLQNISAPILILVGVAHKAARLGIEGSLVFESFSAWKGPWKNVPVSPARDEIFRLLGSRYAIRSDTLHKVEHSLESMIPFLQYFNRDVSIVPILVTAMDPARMRECGKALADAVRKVAADNGWEWGRDYALIVTTDAVHYGNEDWGGTDMAFFGCDSTGNNKALAREHEIIGNCLAGQTGPDNFRRFISYTLKPDNFREYQWTWCGRYSMPVALFASHYLNNMQPLNGELLGYSTSITSEHVPVDDIGMGRTAIATGCHWVGYAALGYG
ncbi:MAG: AmmeMemoRadiSam system protein B [Bacteroidales bacterium]